MTTKEKALLMSLFAADADGNVFIRLVTGKPTGLTNAVNTQSNTSLGGLLSKAIVLDADGNPALRFTAVKYGQTREAAERTRRTKMAADEKKRVAEQRALHTGKAEEE